MAEHDELNDEPENDEPEENETEDNNSENDESEDDEEEDDESERGALPYYGGMTIIIPPDMDMPGAPGDDYTVTDWTCRMMRINRKGKWRSSLLLRSEIIKLWNKEMTLDDEFDWLMEPENIVDLIVHFEDFIPDYDAYLKFLREELRTKYTIDPIRRN